MVRKRVLSFMSVFGPKNNDSDKEGSNSSSNVTLAQTPPRYETPSPPSELAPTGGAATPRSDGKGARPASTIFSRNPPLMTHAEDTPPELSPIFSFLNIHTNKVYHEGYFLKLNDQDNQGRPCADRQWLECYAQLVGTVLSLWDASALDATDGAEVPATFINLADASIKMIETLPVRNGAAPPLNNVLSLSSAGRNRYLLHFSSYHSLIQWTAAVRLAMFEHTSLYEAYTGSLIAAKGKSLNGIQTILAPTRFQHEDWCRVRFGAGTPWRRCWFVINPPDAKEMAKAKKAAKKSAYDRLSIPVTGNIQFFETKKTKKATPIATVTHVYSAYAIYPQAEALIDQSTLVKLEGRITMHGQGQGQQPAEGFVFVMPELHPAVSGFEMMLRFLFPTFDTFNLYGRPTRLVADTNHIKSIMFAFPQERRYGYLDVIDIINLLQSPESKGWDESQWRRKLKEATQKRQSAGRSRTNSVRSARPRYRSSISSHHNGSHLNDSPRRYNPAPVIRPEFNQSADAVVREVPKNDAPVSPIYHNRGFSDVTGLHGVRPPSYGGDNSPNTGDDSLNSSAQDLLPRDRDLKVVTPIAERRSAEMDFHLDDQEQVHPRTPPSPVASPPAFSHGPREMPNNRPEPDSRQRLANNRMSYSTLTQLRSVGNMGGSGSSLSFQEQPSDSSSVELLSNQAPNQIGGAVVQPTQLMSPPLEHHSSDEGLRGAKQYTGGHGQYPGTPSTTSTSTPSPQRKPPVVSAASGEPSYDDLRHTLDENVLNSISPAHLPSPTSPKNEDEASVYDDAISTVSPDYASTHDSVYSKKSTSSTKPRMGLLKTVGQPAKQDLVIGDAHYSTDKPAEPSPDIPTVDFGPTMTYMPTTGRPSTGDTIRKLSVPTNAMDHGHIRPSSQDDHRRSMLWQPGMTAGRPTTPGGGLTPEQFVQTRAETRVAPSPPAHKHLRSKSHTPPLQRPSSGDWTQQVRPNSRMTSYGELSQRPSSRGTGSMLNYNDMSSHLSAREQEHIARVTHSPFFDMSQDRLRSQAPVNPGGLVSTIDVREREKREMREGMSNQMVQHAIAQRQQQQLMQQQQQQHMNSMYGAPSVYQQPQPAFRHDSMYNLPGASQTWDALHQPHRLDEPRRSSWYGQLAQAPQTPPPYQQNQGYAHHGYLNNNMNSMHY
ncbi:hypothetical protein N7468_000900 [Penicillium chermesinum]|uniref:PH domain-containing protein n=1 Tax=Penicillium chermesinum TaxID=63820 RepID=A0A9W9TWH3_9EURO|nr:uncharacterized protein N7468_000900 [Penicillium chermesinum]KAJ5245917.1 hypothetical protein N7468_000900 [Penicillium chermesinum]